MSGGRRVSIKGWCRDASIQPVIGLSRDYHILPCIMPNHYLTSRLFLRSKFVYPLVQPHDEIYSWTPYIRLSVSILLLSLYFHFGWHKLIFHSFSSYNFNKILVLRLLIYLEFFLLIYHHLPLSSTDLTNSFTKVFRRVMGGACEMWRFLDPLPCWGGAELQGELSWAARCRCSWLRQVKMEVTIKTLITYWDRVSNRLHRRKHQIPSYSMSPHWVPAERQEDEHSHGAPAILCVWGSKSRRKSLGVEYWIRVGKRIFKSPSSSDKDVWAEMPEECPCRRPSIKRPPNGHTWARNAV